ncbi:MAG: OmpA family protein [Spirochaetia bacterium]
MSDEDDNGKEKAKPNTMLWIVTYSDMVTLMLCFFVIMMGEPTKDDSRIRLVLNAFGGLGPLTGGMTFNQGKLAQMGADVTSLPASKRAKNLEEALRKAQALVQPETINTIQNITFDPERGLVISLVGDAFFRPDSAEVDLDNTRETLQRLVIFLNSPEVAEQTFRIEGHTNTAIPDPARWPSNWELSSIRAINTLHALSDYGLSSDQNFQVTGLADTKPVAQGNTPEAAAMNRRIEIVMLVDGHL